MKHFVPFVLASTHERRYIIDMNSCIGHCNPWHRNMVIVRDLAVVTVLFLAQRAREAHGPVYGSCFSNFGARSGQIGAKIQTCWKRKTAAATSPRGFWAVRPQDRRLPATFMRPGGGLERQRMRSGRQDPHERLCHDDRFVGPRNAGAKDCAVKLDGLHMPVWSCVMFFCCAAWYSV